MRYAVLYTTSHDSNEGRSWAIVEAESPTQAASMAGGRSIATDDKALVIELATNPTPVYAKVGWTE